jgi:hypothetical protein
VKLRGNLTSGAYTLRLETKHGVVRGIGLFESATEVEYRSGTKRENRWTYAFVVSHDARGPNGGWALGVSYSEVGTVMGARGAPSSGEGFGRACRRPSRVPTALYAEVLSLMASAQRRESVQPQPGASCFARS